MIKRIGIMLLVAILVSCVSKNKHDKLQKGFVNLQITNDSLNNMLVIANNKITTLNFVKDKYEKLVEIKRKKARKGKVKKYYTESKARSLMKDYYSFYRRDYVYKDLSVRRIDDNSFNMSYKEAGRHVQDDDFFYHAKVEKLTIVSDTKYQFNP